MEEANLWLYEQEAMDSGYSCICGCDEAGAGPLAGPVYAAAVILPPGLELPWLNDSKQLTAKKRENLAEVIKTTPGCTWAIASASPQEIDNLNILNATYLAMRRAAEDVGRQLGHGNIKILVDGNPAKGLPYPSQNLVKGDAKSLFIAAASILAKTARDADCERLEREYPGYGFAKHKGYPTKVHMEALRKLGPCPEHRRSFAPVANVCNQMQLPLG